MLDGSDRQTVIAYDPQLSAAHHVCAGAFRFLVGKGVMRQKSIEGFFSAIELVQLVCTGEGFDGRKSFILRCHSSTLFSARSLARRGFRATGRDSTSWKAFHWSSSSLNER